MHRRLIVAASAFLYAAAAVPAFADDYPPCTSPTQDRCRVVPGAMDQGHIHYGHQPGFWGHTYYRHDGRGHHENGEWYAHKHSHRYWHSHGHGHGHWRWHSHWHSHGHLPGHEHPYPGSKP